MQTSNPAQHPWKCESQGTEWITLSSYALHRFWFLTLEASMRLTFFGVEVLAAVALANVDFAGTAAAAAAADKE
jgi:hypothetical protein